MTTDELMIEKIADLDASTFQELTEDKSLNNNSNTNITKKSICSKIDNWDKHYSLYIHNLEVITWVEVFIYIMARFYNPECMVVYFIIMLIYAHFKDQNYLYIAKPLIHVIIGLIFTLVLKKIINRQRPTLNEKIKRKFNCRNRETNASFPSGDSLQSINFSIIMIYYYGLFYFLITVPLVMFARIFYHCHYILDTIGGVIIGTLLSTSTYYVLRCLKF